MTNLDEELKEIEGWQLLAFILVFNVWFVNKTLFSISEEVLIFGS